MQTANSRGMERCIPDSVSGEADREAARRSQLDTLLNVLTNVPSNALDLLSVHAITTFINSPKKEFEMNPACSLLKLHSPSSRAWQTEGQRVRTGHDELTV